jgi:hypothetical protein
LKVDKIQIEKERENIHSFIQKKNFDEREQGLKFRKKTVNRIKQRKEKWKKTKQSRKPKTQKERFCIQNIDRRRKRKALWRNKKLFHPVKEVFDI